MSFERREELKMSCVGHPHVGVVGGGFTSTAAILVLFILLVIITRMIAIPF
jgi:hypothetical protein